MNAAAWRPRVLVGATTGTLDPQIPSPVYRPSPVAIELADGIGFGLDGNALVVSQGAPSSTITGHLDDGTYPQRDFKVSTQGDTTTVSGYYDPQNYSLKRSGNTVTIQNSDPDFCSTVTQNGPALHADGPKPVQRYDIAPTSDGFAVNGYSSQESARIINEANGNVLIQGDIPERTFEISRTPTGLHIEGQGEASKPRTFDVTFTSDGFVIQGCYPQQKYVVKAG